MDERTASEYETKKKSTYKQLENAKIEIGKDFEQENELKEKTIQLKEINEELGIKDDEKDDLSTFDDVDEDIADKETINKNEPILTR